MKPTQDSSHLFFVFGLCGVGKNFVGEIFKNFFNFHFWDADNALTEPMKNCIKERRLFTREMIVSFVESMIEKTYTLQQEYPRLVVAQALYREEFRLEIKRNFPTAQFCHVTAPLPNIIRQILQRNNHIDVQYAEDNRRHFESPCLPHHVIDNSGDQETIIQQIQVLINNLPYTSSAILDHTLHPMAMCKA